MPWRNLGNRTNVQLKFLDKLNWASNGRQLCYTLFSRLRRCFQRNLHKNPSEMEFSTEIAMKKGLLLNFRFATAPFSLEIQLTKKVFIPKDQGTKTYNFRGTTLIMYKTYTSLKVKISSKIASICQIRSFHQPLPLLIFKSYLLILFIAFCYLFMTKLYFIYSFLSINSSF